MNGCDSCVDQARERNREMTNLLIIAKTKAVEENKPKAICNDEASGFFISDAQAAFTNHFNIVRIVSNV